MHTISCMQNASLYLSATAQNRVALGGLMFVIVFMIKSIIKYVLRDH